MSNEEYRSIPGYAKFDKDKHEFYNNHVMFNGGPYHVFHKFNITTKELEAALEYSKKHGSSNTGCIMMAKGGGNVGGMLFVGKNWEDDATDISDYEAI
jgi:hypothetical protein